jgi:hypothetical protein
MDASPDQTLAWVVQRWQVEVTFHAMRAHLGMETQRQWSTLAIARTTPTLFGLFSAVTLLAHPHCSQASVSLQQAAWYTKSWPTFADALAWVRRRLWASLLFQTSVSATHPEVIRSPLLDHLCALLCYAA